MLEAIYIVVMMLLLFGATIFVHEFGHFIVAKWCGLVIETFSIGMGPALWKKEKNGIVYKIGAFPIGGYVSLPQLDPEGMEKMQGENETDRKQLPDVSPWKKIAVSFAGPLCNVLFAIPLALIVMTAEQPAAHTTIGTVSTNSVAHTEGIKAGDQILEINDKPVADWYSILVEDLMAEELETTTLKVKSGDEVRTVVMPTDEVIGIEGVDRATSPLLAQILAKQPAAEAGIKTGDLIIGINGIPINWWHELAAEIQKYDNQTVPFNILRGDKTIELMVTPKYYEEYERVMIGVTPGDPGMLAWTMSGNPFDQIGNDASKIFRLLKALTTKGEAKQAASGLGGPIAIFTMIWFSIKLGLPYAIGLIRFLNINLAVLNLLPLPVLDGGHICFALWEGITKRKVHPKVVMTLVNIFAILLISAMLILSWRDADRNWGISRIFNVFKKADIEQVEESVSADGAVKPVDAPTK